MDERRFRDRTEAGELLAARLAARTWTRPLVLGLVRGGVLVAEPVARALSAPLDVIVARKIGAPAQPEFAIGAVAPGVTILRRDVMQLLGLSDRDIENAAALEGAQLDDMARLYRGSRGAERIGGRDVIVVDDGLATGTTAAAALRSVRLEEPRRVVLAVPVCATDSPELLAAECDEVVCLHAVRELVAVGMWYEDFAPVSDDEVRELLQGATDGELEAWRRT